MLYYAAKQPFRKQTFLEGDNEIDLIAENEPDKSVVFIEIKRQASRYDEAALTAKTDAFLQTTGKFKNYRRTVKGLSLTDM